MRKVATGVYGTGAKIAKGAMPYINAGVRLANMAVAVRNKARQIRNMKQDLKDARLVKRTQIGGGDYQQFTEFKASAGKKKSFKQIMPALVKASAQRLIWRYAGLKEFDNFGFYPCYQQGTLTTVNYLPIYILDLTARNAIPSVDTIKPFRRMYMDMTGTNTGKVRWADERKVLDDGSISTDLNTWSIEERPNNLVSQAATACDKEYLNWTSCKLNSFGHRFIYCPIILYWFCCKIHYRDWETDRKSVV